MPGEGYSERFPLLEIDVRLTENATQRPNWYFCFFRNDCGVDE